LEFVFWSGASSRYTLQSFCGEPRHKKDFRFYRGYGMGFQKKFSKINSDSGIKQNKKEETLRLCVSARLKAVSKQALNHDFCSKNNKKS